ncbi:MAG TPA: class I SAM-dependent methyltransferase [Bryobacteraceae bacterium]|nr:class I SAM-dependent methyltransferase [Bryobacteraceae bacterium]
MHSHINFAYPWPFVYGHLVVTAIAGAILALALWRKWSLILIVPVAALTLWAASAFVMVRFGFDLNGRATMPTQNFLKSGSGRVLDMGAGTGRSSIMILEARPNTTLVALDSFGESYVEHFGGDESKPAQVLDEGRQRLMANLQAAGVENRATIQPGDMRKLPFPDASFDAIVSAYAIDHLNEEGIRSALSEASRVLKPKGEFLLMLVYKDTWLKYTFGPVLMHAGMRRSSRWVDFLHDAGFQIAEQGTRPATLYFVAQKP